MSRAIHKNTVASGVKCAFCRPKKVPALWRPDVGFLDHKNIACDKHRERIEEADMGEEHLTEADRQTWMML